MGRSLLAAALGLAASVEAFKVHPQSMQLSVGAVGVLTTEPQKCVDWQSSDNSVVVIPLQTDSKCQYGSSAAYLFAKTLPDQGETIISTVQVRDMFGASADATVYVGHVNELQISYSSDVLPTGTFGELKLATLDDDGGKQAAVGRAFAASVFPIDRCNDKHCAELARELSTDPLPVSDSSVVDICTIRRLAGSDQPPSAEMNIRYSAEQGRTPLPDMPPLVEYPTEQIFSDVLLVAGGKRPGRVAVCVQLVPSSLEVLAPGTGRHTLCQPLAITDRLHAQPLGPLAMALGSTLQLCLFRTIADGSVELAEGLATDCGWPVHPAAAAEKGAPSRAQTSAGSNQTAAVSLLLHDPNHTWLSTDASVLRVDNNAPGVLTALSTGSVHVIVLDDRLSTTDLQRPLEGYTLACASAVSSGAALPKGCTDMSNGFDLTAKVDRLDGVQVWTEPLPRIVGYRAALAGLVGAYPTLGEATTSSVPSPTTANTLPDWDYRISPGLQYVTPAVQAVQMARTAGRSLTLRCTGTSASTCKPLAVAKTDSEDTKPLPVLQLVAGQVYAFHVQATGESGSRLVLGHTLRSEIIFTHATKEESKTVNVSVLSAPAAVQSEGCRTESASTEITSSGYLFRVLPCSSGPYRMRLVLTDRNAKAQPLDLTADVLVREPVQLLWPAPVQSLSTKALNVSASHARGVSPLGSGLQHAAVEATKQVPVLSIPVVLANADIAPAKLRLAAAGGSGDFTFRTSVLKSLASSSSTGPSSGSSSPSLAGPRPCMASMSGSCERTAVKVDAVGVLTVISGPESDGESGVEIVDGSDAGNGYLLAVRTAVPTALVFGAQKVEMDVAEEVYVPIFAKDASSTHFDICDNLAAGLKWSIASAASADGTGSAQEPSVSITAKGWAKEGSRPGLIKEALPVVDSACGYVRIQGVKTGSSRLSVSLKLGPGQELVTSLLVDVYHPLRLVYPAPSLNPAAIKGQHMADVYHAVVGSSLAAAVIGGPQTFGPESTMVQQVFAYACVNDGNKGTQLACGQATDVHIVHASQRAATLVSSHGVQVLLESVRAVIDSGASGVRASSAGQASASMAPAYLVRIQCIASSPMPLVITLRLGSKHYKDSFKSMAPSAAVPTLRLKMECSAIGGLKAVVMPEAAAYEAYSASLSNNDTQFSLYPRRTSDQHVLYTGEPSILAVFPITTTGEPYINSTGVPLLITHTPTTLPATWQEGASKGIGSNGTVSILHVAAQPYFFGQLTADWRAQSVSAKAASHMTKAGPYARPSLEELLYLYGGSAQSFRHRAESAEGVVPLRVNGHVGVARMESWSQEEKYWITAAHSGMIAAGIEVASTPGAALLSVSLKSSPDTETGTVVVSGTPAVLLPSALPLYSLAGVTASFACTGGSGVHTFSINGSTVPASATTPHVVAGLVTAHISSGSSSKLLPSVPAATQSTTIQLTSTGHGEGMLTVECGDDLVFGKSLVGKPLRGTVYVASAEEVTVGAPRLLALGTAAAVDIKVHTADGLVFPANQLTHMNISVHVSEGSVGGPETIGVIADRAVGTTHILLDSPTLTIEQYWNTAGELRFRVIGKAVGAVQLSAVLSRCQGDACAVLQSASRSLYVYPPLQAYPPAPVLLPDAGLQLQILGGPPGGFDSSEVAVRFSVDQPDLLLVTSDGIVQSLGGEGNATVTAHLVPVEEAGQIPRTIYGTVIIPIRVCKPSAVRLYVQGAGVVSDRAERWSVMVADANVQLVWDTPEGHGPLSIAGLGDKVKVQWTTGTAGRGDGIAPLPWKSAEDVRPFKLLSRAHALAEDTASTTVYGLNTAMYAANIAQPAHCRLSMTLSFTSSQYGPMLFTSTVAVGVVPRAQLLYPSPLAFFAQGVHLLLPVGSVARPATNLHVLFGTNITVAVTSDNGSTGKPSQQASSSSSVLSCSAKKGDARALMRMQVSATSSAPSGVQQSSWKLFPVQTIAMEVECARPRDVLIVPSAATGAGDSGISTGSRSKPGAELSIAYHASQSFKVVAVDSTGRVFGTGLAALCPLGSMAKRTGQGKGIASTQTPASGIPAIAQTCMPSTLGLLAYSSLPAVTSASLSFDEHEDAVLTIRGESLGSALVHVISSSWGDAGTGDSITASVRASVLPAGAVTLLPGSEVRLEVSTETLSYQLELLKASAAGSAGNKGENNKEYSKLTIDSLASLVRWTVSNDTVAASLPEWPKIKHGSSHKKRSHASGMLWGRIVALSGGTTIATATVKVPGSAQTVLTLGSATVHVVNPSDVHAVLAPAPLHEIESGAYAFPPVGSSHSHKKMVLSDAHAGSAGALAPNGAVGVLTMLSQATAGEAGASSSTSVMPTVFMLRLFARSGKNGAPTELHSNDYVTHRLSFECTVQINAAEGGGVAGATGKEVQKAWFASAAIGPGATRQAFAWSINENHTAAEALVDYELSNNEAATATSSSKQDDALSFQLYALLNAGRASWPAVSRHARLCVVAPRTLPLDTAPGIPPVPAPTRVTVSAQVQMFAPSRLYETHSGLLGSSPVDKGASFHSVTLQPQAPVAAPFKAAVRVVPLHLAKGIAESGSATVLHYDSSTRSSLATAGPADGSIQAKSLITLGKGLPAVEAPVALGTAAGKSSVALLTYNTGSSCTLGTVDTRLHARIQSVAVVDRKVEVSGWAASPVQEVLNKMCKGAVAGEAVHSCPACLLTVAVAPHVLESAAGGQKSGSGAPSLSFAWAAVSVLDRDGTSAVPLFFAFDDANHAITPKQAAGESSSGSGSGDEVVKAQAEAQSRQKSKAASARMAAAAAARAGLPQPSASAVDPGMSMWTVAQYVVLTVLLAVLVAFVVSGMQDTGGLRAPISVPLQPSQAANPVAAAAITAAAGVPIAAPARPQAPVNRAQTTLPEFRPAPVHQQQQGDEPMRMTELGGGQQQAPAAWGATGFSPARLPRGGLGLYGLQR